MPSFRSPDKSELGIAARAARIADSSARKSQDAASSCPAFGRREQICLMLGDEGIDHFIQRFAGHDLVELVESQMDPVVGEPPLREIISADSFGAIAGTDLGTPVSGALRRAFLPLRVIDP